MATDDVVQVSIRGDAAQLIAQMKAAASATGNAGAQMKAELAGIGAGAKEAHAPMNAFASVIKEYRSEMRQEARMGRFLAADIASMGLASKGAAGEVTQLVAAFAFGNGLGGGIEVVKMLVKHLTEVYDETKRTEELTKLYGADLKAMGEEGAKHVATLKKSITDVLLSMKELRSETMLRHELEEPLKREKELKEQIAKFDEQIAAGAASAAWTEAGRVTQDVSLLESRKAKLEEELRKVRAEMSGLRGGAAPLKAVDIREIAVAESIEEAKRAAAQETEDNA